MSKPALPAHVQMMIARGAGRNAPATQAKASGGVAPHVAAAIARTQTVQRKVAAPIQRAKQSLITNYFPMVSPDDHNQPLITNYAARTFEEALNRANTIPNFHPEAGLVIEGGHGTFVATINGVKVGELSLYKDGGGRRWINNIDVKSSLHKRGIGGALVRAAVGKYGAIYASTASKMEEDEQNDPMDTRHLSQEGAALVTSCVRKGILRDEWVLNPYE